MTTDKTYNGWTNYETWCVNLWLSNDEGLYLTVWDMRPVDADSLKDLVDSLVEWHNSIQGTFILDLVNAALSEVNWDEIAAAWNEED